MTTPAVAQKSWPWFNMKFATFWQPIIDPGEQWWRDEHIFAHLVGGVAISLVLHFVVVGYYWHGQLHILVDFPQHVALRLAGTAFIQATLWELVQRENWRPELMGLAPGANHGYPWLSAIWDTLTALGGAVVLESLQALGVHLL